MHNQFTGDLRPPPVSAESLDGFAAVTPTVTLMVHHPGPRIYPQETLTLTLVALSAPRSSLALSQRGPCLRYPSRTRTFHTVAIKLVPSEQNPADAPFQTTAILTVPAEGVVRSFIYKQ